MGVGATAAAAASGLGFRTRMDGTTPTLDAYYKYLEPLHRVADGLRWAEVAEILGESEPAVRQRCSRTLRELREALRDAPARELAHE